MSGAASIRGSLARAARLGRFGVDLAVAAHRIRRPTKLTFVVTDACSCRCAICALWKEPRTGAGTAEIRALFAANPFLSWINLSGGEVVERGDFEEIAAAAVESTRCAALDFPTAGQRPETVERGAAAALRAGVPRLFVSVSLDGPPEIHDALRGTPGAFARALETIDRLRSGAGGCRATPASRCRRATTAIPTN
jgi:MoaA/NifB/PqqE/SkfB family radical SAM enzyme